MNRPTPKKNERVLRLATKSVNYSDDWRSSRGLPVRRRGLTIKDVLSSAKPLCDDNSWEIARPRDI
jgi:hypothetical protein